MKTFISGRNNLATTIYVPFDCANNCKFCTSKALYKNCDLSLDNVLNAIKQTNEIGNTDIVITGGEPMNNISALTQIIDSIAVSKNVYINTSFINKNVFEFMQLVNSNPKIKGVNISRHADKAENEQLANCLSDNYLHFIEKPIKINCVLTDDFMKSKFVFNVIERYSKYNVRISFRADFTKTTNDNLHSLETEQAKYFIENFIYQKHIYCNVCDTLQFKTENGKQIDYHRGLELTSIENEKQIEVNDIIIYPDGKIAYDWDGKNFDTKNKIATKIDTVFVNLFDTLYRTLRLPIQQCCCEMGRDDPSYSRSNSGGCGSGGC